MDNRALVEQYFAAMRRGADAEETMLGLFTDDVIYSDPFVADEQTGPASATKSEPEPVIGIVALRDRLRSGWEFSPPDLELTVLSVVIDGDQAEATWECRSTVFAHPMRGRDVYRFRDGRIAELHVRMLDASDG